MIGVPTTDDRLFAWLTGLGRGPAACTTPSAELVLREGYEFVRLRSVAAFWEARDAASPGAAMTTLIDGIGRAGCSLVFIAVRDEDELVLTLGARRLSADGLQTLMLSAFQGAVATPLQDEPAAGARALNALQAGAMARAAVVGVPGAGRAQQLAPLLERLATSNVPCWSLAVHARALPRAALLERFAALSARRQDIANATTITRQRTATVQQTEHDVRRTLLAQLLQAEEERMLTGSRQSAFVTETWLSAPDPTALGALAAVTDGCLVSPRGQPFPAEVVAHAADGDDARALLLGSELARLLVPPIHDARGFPVRAWARFDQAPERIDTAGAELTLGHTPAGAPLTYPVDRLAAHALVTGLTGSGKTSLLRALLGSVGVPWLVLEPAKRDWVLGADPGTAVWLVGDPRDAGQLRLNPLEVPAGTPLTTHIDLLIALLRASLQLPSPLPEILELALQRCYVRRGWDLASSSNAFAAVDPDYPVQPTLKDLLHECRRLIVASSYDAEVRGNVLGALETRLGSLVTGAKGRALQTTQPFPVDDLLTRDTIVNLDAVGSDEEKAFVVGLLLLRLLGARRGQQRTALQHLTVIEEAHRLLRRDPPPSGGDDAPGPSFASETIGAMMAEIRSAGEGLIVVDQAPHKLTLDAAANTALQVAFRAKLAEDKDALASAMNLDDAQRSAMTGLPRHQAAVFWEGMDRPVLADMSRDFGRPRRRFAAASAPQVAVPATSLELHDARLDQLAAVAVRAAPDERAVVMAAMNDRAADLLPGRLGTLRADAVQTAITRVIDDLALQRHWAQPPPADEVLPALLDGRRPHPGCAVACPGGGCPVGELVAPAADALRSAGAEAEWLRRPDLIPDHARVTAARVLGHADVPSLEGIARRCTVVQVLADSPPDIVASQILTASRDAQARRGEPRRSIDLRGP